MPSPLVLLPWLVALVRMGSRKTSPDCLCEGPAASDGCRGRACLGNLQSLQRGTQKRSLWWITCPCPGEGGTRSSELGGCPLPPALSCIRFLAHTSPKVLVPSPCLGDSSDGTVAAAVWPEESKASEVPGRTVPLVRKPPREGGGKLCRAASAKVGLESNSASQRQESTNPEEAEPWPERRAPEGRMPGAKAGHPAKRKKEVCRTNLPCFQR